MRAFLKFFASKLVILMLAAAGLATLVLGFWGWTEALTDTDANELDILFLTLRAFVFGDEYSGLDLSLFGEAVELNWQLKTGRWTGALVAFGALFEAVRTLFSAPLQRFAAWRRFGHAVVIGDASIARKFAEAWVARRRRKVTHHADEPEDDWDGVLTLPRNARLEEGIARGSLRWADRIVIAEWGDAATAETALAAARLRPKTPVFAVVRDAWLAEHLRHTVEDRPSKTWKGDALISVSEHAAAARAVLGAHPPFLLAQRAGQARIHLLIAGFGGLGEALVRDVMHTNQVIGLEPMRITIVDPEGAAREEAFATRYPGLMAEYDIAFISCDAGALNAGALDQLRTRIAEGPVTAAYVATGEESPPLKAALGLQEIARREGLFDPPIFVSARDGAGLPRREGGAVFEGGAELVAFGSWADITVASGMLDRDPDDLARDFHETYRTLQSGGPADTDWPALTERLRNSNRRAVAHMPAKLTSLGFEITPLLRGGDLSPAARPTIHSSETLFRNASELMALARLEHQRWMADRLVDGWRYGETRDDLKRTHPNLVPFDDLSPDIARYDIVLAARLKDWIATSRKGLRRAADRSTPPPERPEDRAAVEAAGVKLT